jgi:branched-chain amino acid aminotransferase
MKKSKDLVVFKGSVIAREDAVVNIMSPTAQFGLNVFEGVRGYWNAERKKLYIFRFSDHVSRLFESCKIIGITTHYSEADIWQLLVSLLEQAEYGGDIAFRLIIFVDGKGSWSSSNTGELCISPIEKPRKEAFDLQGYSACISTWQRISDRSMPPRVKAGANYVSGRYSQLEAQRSGYDVPILLTSEGMVAEAPGACLFMVRGGKLVTPTLNSVLESLTRLTLMELAAVDGQAVMERPIERTELYVADEVFLCGTSAEIMPIVSIDGVTVGDGTPGELTLKLFEMYHKVVSHKDSNCTFSNWVTAI